MNTKKKKARPLPAKHQTQEMIKKLVDSNNGMVNQLQAMQGAFKETHARLNTLEESVRELQSGSDPSVHD